MRMDRYEDEFKQNENKQTRTNKNQELYTDVYLNNVYVDINNLKDVVNSQEEVFEVVKLVRDKKVINYSYEDKNYDIVSIIHEVIKNKKDDNVKRSLDVRKTEEEIASLIEIIEENIEKKETDRDSDLLSDLLPNSENTTVIPPLSEPILDDESLLEVKEQEIDNDIVEKDLESDESFLDENDNSKLKMILSIIMILVFVGLVVGILLYKDII